jgi:hypothetical protein
LGFSPHSSFSKLWGVAPNPSYFLYLDIKKVTKERSRLQRILGLLFFGLPTQYNSQAFGLLKQYCLQQAHAASLKTVAITQNSLRPFEIQKRFGGMARLTAIGVYDVQRMNNLVEVEVL